jgi:hypothetical protein
MFHQILVVGDKFKSLLVDADFIKMKFILSMGGKDAESNPVQFNHHGWIF